MIVVGYATHVSACILGYTSFEQALSQSEAGIGVQAGKQDGSAGWVERLDLEADFWKQSPG